MQAKSKNKNSKVKKNSYPKSAIFRPRDLKLFSCAIFFEDLNVNVPSVFSCYQKYRRSLEVVEYQNKK